MTNKKIYNYLQNNIYNIDNAAVYGLCNNNMAGVVDVKANKTPSISHIFNTMEYGPAPEDDKVAQV